MEYARKTLGANGETRAAGYLERIGYQILDRNYRCRYGELDLVARHQGVLVFVEVKTRRNSSLAPAEAVGPRKQDRLARAALHYLDARSMADHPCRFDVVEVVLNDGQLPIIRLISDAFEARKDGC